MHMRWAEIRKRCSEHAGGDDLRYYRGVKVCPEWDDFTAFRDWALANGYQPNLQIDRIDTTGDYTPANCRFVTASVNSRNRSTTKLVAGSVRFIRLLLEVGYKPKDLASRFGVAVKTIRKVARREIWCDV